MLRRFVFHSSSKGAFPMTMTNNNSVRYCSTYTAAQLDSMSLPEWSEAFKKATIGLASMDVQTITYEQSASRMRTLVKSGILRYDDIVKRPERFFEAHRLLAYHSPRLGPGFWIRFTVHYNLCVGTVVGLGNTQQLQELEQWQNSGLLGCFSLTEKFAGVNSGMIVNTVAEYEPITKSFVITTPSHGAKKNWISQGLVADKTVVVADLKIEGQSVGPHAFMMSLRENGAVVNGVEHGDMGRKTIGNDLDNAWIAFNSVRIPHSALLSRFCEVTPEGRYVQKVKDLPVFHMIGQRLFTGRVAVAQAALAFRKGLFESTKATTDTKLCWSPGGDMALSAIPQLASLYDKEAKAHTLIESFVRKCETELVAVLKAGKVPSVQLVEAIAVAKVKAVEESIDFVHRLKNEVGSLALMADTGFGNTDFLQCCKFAEGDSRILMQKMARDRMKLFAKKPDWGTDAAEKQACVALAKAIEGEVKTFGVDRNKAWDNQWESVYQLADVYMQRVMREYTA